jgi:hypothetical protein
MPAEYRVNEHAIAEADVAIGWVYGIAGLGLMLGAPWGYKVAWIPGSILVCHAVSLWAWTGNARRSGVVLATGKHPLRAVWALINLLTGLLALLVAWNRF